MKVISQTRLTKASAGPHVSSHEPTGCTRTTPGPYGMIEYTLFIPKTTEVKPQAAAFAVPGWSMEMESVAPVVERLAEDRNQIGIAIQNPGLGATDLGVDTNHTNYALRATENVLAVLAEIQNEFGITGVVVIGHSMGGQIATLAMDRLTSENRNMKPIAAILIAPVPKDPVMILAKGVLATITKIGVCAVSGLIRLCGDKMSKPIDYVVRGLMYATHALGYVQLLNTSKEAQVAHSKFWQHFYTIPMRVVTIGMEGMRRAGAQTAEALSRLVEKVPITVIQATWDTLVNRKVGDIVRNDAGPNAGNVNVATVETGHFSIEEAFGEVMKQINALLDRLPKPETPKPETQKIAHM